MAKDKEAPATRDLSDPDWGLVYKFAIALEKGRFNDYIATLQNTKALFWKSLLSGMAKGLGVVLGGTVVAGLVFGLLALIGPHLPHPADTAIENTGQKILQPGK